MSTQHTPGPWKVKAGSNAVLAGRKQICSHVNAASVLPVNIVEDHKIAEANARLIAAAPELLEALKKFALKHRHTYGLDGAWDEEITMAEKAIAKATGGS
jgi:hypothetical protein